MPEQTAGAIPESILRYLESQEQGRVETANDAMKQLTDRERHVLREAAVMGWVRGAMSAGGGSESIPKDIAILVEVINCCRSNADLYPKIAAAANRELEPTWRDVLRAMRAAEWTGRGGASWRMWGAWSGEDVNDQHGWVIRYQFLRTVKFTVVGPGTGHMTNRSYTELINPTPAKVLAAARLVGLGGGHG